MSAKKKTTVAAVPPSRVRVLVTQGSWSSRIANIVRTLGAEALENGRFSEAERTYASATHVILTGGTDIDPSYYGMAPTYSFPADLQRDMLESRLADQAILDRKPLLGICRGHQMITAVAGGTLYQDIGAELGLKHLGEMHSVLLREGSLLHSIFGTEEMQVNSYHHQAVQRMPRGWRVTAKTPDGIVEAIERPGWPVLSVQWHPEVMDTQHLARLFFSFLGLTRGVK